MKIIFMRLTDGNRNMDIGYYYYFSKESCEVQRAASYRIYGVSIVCSCLRKRNLYTYLVQIAFACDTGDPPRLSFMWDEHSTRGCHSSVTSSLRQSLHSLSPFPGNWDYWLLQFINTEASENTVPVSKSLNFLRSGHYCFFCIDI